VEPHANNRIAADPRPPQTAAATQAGVRTLHAAAVVITALAFLQNLRRGGYELGTETPRSLRLAVALTELASAI
jgi:hypothetical protein